eukprot:GILI01043203.1.p1 GENE.GILI01043203.1~~GILI01043203.1.p1  ORF type:complete len:322 (+),score=54.47 GILI01043203.1:136-1101(+)
MTTSEPSSSSSVASTPPSSSTSNSYLIFSKQTVAGAASGAFSRFCVAPLDVVKIRLQLQVEHPSQAKYKSVLHCLRTIFKEEGVVALWKGNLAAEFLWTSYTAMQFGMYAQLQTLAQSLLDAEPNASTPVSILARNLQNPLVAGGLSGAVGTICTYPFDLARTRLAGQGEPKIYTSLYSLGSKIVREEGFSGFYKGLPATLAQIIPYIGMQFVVYEYVKSTLKEHNVSPLVSGALAGLIPKLAVHPLDVVKKRMQMDGVCRSASQILLKPSRSSTLSSTMSSIWRNEGIRGFYKGLAPSLIKAVPSSALTFFAYEQALKLL